MWTHEGKRTTLGCSLSPPRGSGNGTQAIRIAQKVLLLSHLTSPKCIPFKLVCLNLNTKSKSNYCTKEQPISNLMTMTDTLPALTHIPSSSSGSSTGEDRDVLWFIRIRTCVLFLTELEKPGHGSDSGGGDRDKTLGKKWPSWRMMRSVQSLRSAGGQGHFRRTKGTLIIVNYAK